MSKKKKADIIVYKSYYAKGSKWNQTPDLAYRYMECKQCKTFTVCGTDAKSVTCTKCVMENIEPPVLKQPKSQRIAKPKGWHFMAEYVDVNGNVFYKGIEQPDMYGKLEPTVIATTIKASKKDKQKYKMEAAQHVGKLKKQLVKARWKKDQKLIIKDIRYFTRILKGKLPADYLQRLYAK